MAGIGGLEPPNDGIKNRCLNQLGYIPKRGAYSAPNSSLQQIDFLTF